MIIHEGDNSEALFVVISGRVKVFLSDEKGKEIVKAIKGMKTKVQGQVMDDQVRVSGKNRDDLQEVIAELKDKDFGIAMSFTNYR